MSVDFEYTMCTTECLLVAPTPNRGIILLQRHAIVSGHFGSHVDFCCKYPGVPGTMELMRHTGWSLAVVDPLLLEVAGLCKQLHWLEPPRYLPPPCPPKQPKDSTKLKHQYKHKNKGIQLKTFPTTFQPTPASPL